MKRELLLAALMIIASDINLNALDLVSSKESEKSGIAFNYHIYNKGYNIHNYSDTSIVTSGMGLMPSTKGNHDLKGKIIRTDRKYNHYLSADKNKFKGHLPIFEIGINSFGKTNYSGYSVPGFMDLNQSKSLEVNLRLLRYSVGLQRFKNNIGLVTGLELNLNDYRFSKPYTIINEDGHTNPVQLTEDGLSKTKLTTTFLTVPVLFEFQIPAKRSGDPLFISGGIIGGLKTGSHTKVKQFDNKTKSHNDFNINPFRYGATFRMGYKDINIFATYYKTPFFKEGRGPEMFPFTVGIGLINK